MRTLSNMSAAVSTLLALLPSLVISVYVLLLTVRTANVDHVIIDCVEFAGSFGESRYKKKQHKWFSAERAVG